MVMQTKYTGCNAALTCSAAKGAGDKRLVPSGSKPTSLLQLQHHGGWVHHSSIVQHMHVAHDLQLLCLQTYERPGKTNNSAGSQDEGVGHVGEAPAARQRVPRPRPVPQQHACREVQTQRGVRQEAGRKPRAPRQVHTVPHLRRVSWPVGTSTTLRARAAVGDWFGSCR
jgi:hypothetical protein